MLRPGKEVIWLNLWYSLEFLCSFWCFAFSSMIKIDFKMSRKYDLGRLSSRMSQMHHKSARRLAPILMVMVKTFKFRTFHNFLRLSSHLFLATYQSFSLNSFFTRLTGHRHELPNDSALFSLPLKNVSNYAFITVLSIQFSLPIHSSRKAAQKFTQVFGYFVSFRLSRLNSGRSLPQQYSNYFPSLLVFSFPGLSGETKMNLIKIYEEQFFSEWNFSVGKQMAGEAIKTLRQKD